jgi:hypothetical protein
VNHEAAVIETRPVKIPLQEKGREILLVKMASFHRQELAVTVETTDDINSFKQELLFHH